jgi:hypothetical protein
MEVLVQVAEVVVQEQPQVVLVEKVEMDLQ